MESNIVVDAEKAQLLCDGQEEHQQQPKPKPRQLSRSRRAVVHLTSAAISLLALFHVLSFISCAQDSQPLSKHIDVDEVQQCAIDNLQSDLWFLDGVKPIEAQEFVDRRDRLARALAENGVDAFVVEPGYTFQYASLLMLSYFRKFSTTDSNFLLVMKVLWQHLSGGLGALGARGATFPHAHPAPDLGVHGGGHSQDGLPLPAFRGGPRPHARHPLPRRRGARYCSLGGALEPLRDPPPLPPVQ